MKAEEEVEVRVKIPLSKKRILKLYCWRKHKPLKEGIGDAIDLLFEKELSNDPNWESVKRFLGIDMR